MLLIILLSLARIDIRLEGDLYFYAILIAPLYRKRLENSQWPNMNRDIHATNFESNTGFKLLHDSVDTAYVPNFRSAL